MKTCIITGAAGFIGSRLCTILREKGCNRVIGCDRLGSDLKWRNLRRAGISDFYDPSELIEVLDIPGYFGAEKPVFFHLGAESSTTARDGAYVMDNNFTFTKNLAGICQKQNYRFIYASSAATYGDGDQGYHDETSPSQLVPMNLYGYSKNLFDIYAEKMGLLDKIAGLKFFNVYGPGEHFKGDMASVMYKSFLQIRDGIEMLLFKSHRDGIADGDQRRDFVYVDDAVEMAFFLAENPTKNGLFNIGSGRAQSFLELTKAMYEAMGKEPNIKYVDMPESIRDKYQYYTLADLGKIRAAGYKHDTKNVEEGAKAYLPFLRSLSDQGEI